MPANQTRGTPGLLLLIFACALLLTAAGAWELRRETPRAVAAVALTGLGDANFYIKLVENDFSEPALNFSRSPGGLFRRTVNPVHRDDAGMLRVETERSGRFNVYTDARPNPGPDGAVSPRWYLKAGDHRYVEFGEEKHPPALPGLKTTPAEGLPHR